MPNPQDDIITNIELSDNEALGLKKAHYQGGGQTRTPPPVQVQNRLNEELLQMLKMGKRFNQFQGIDRCIRVLDPGTPNQRHCMAMMVKDLTRNMVVCSSCDRIKDVNANPKTINSSAIKLDRKDLEEMGLEKDLTESMKPIKEKSRQKSAKVTGSIVRRPKVAVPNSVKIEITMKELQNNPNVISVLLQKTLDAIFELPVKNFREAEEIRVVKERVEGYLKVTDHEELQGD
jgi:hypothetical protein